LESVAETVERVGTLRAIDDAGQTLGLDDGVEIAFVAAVAYREL